MSRLLLLVLAALAGSAMGQTSTPNQDMEKWLAPSNEMDWSTLKQCLHMPDVIDLCGGDKPTIWLNPKLEPRDAANRLLGAFEAMGYLPVEKRP